MGRSKIRVLLADDHKTLRLALARFLNRQLDIQIVGQAGDGATAVKLAGERQPDVIVMDLSMPDMHGIQATRLIRSRSPGTRVIGFSAYAAPEHSKAMRKAGAIHYLTKRDKPATLVAAIRASASRSRKRPTEKAP